LRCSYKKNECIDELFLSDNGEYCQDDIDDFLKSSGNELCLVNMERKNGVESIDDGYNEILMNQVSYDVRLENIEEDPGFGSCVYLVHPGHFE